MLIKIANYVFSCYCTSVVSFGAAEVAIAL